MDDEKIIKLYWERSEAAINESADKYGSLCSSVASNILADRQDCEECVSDTWMGAWNAMPPARPTRLGAFFAKITRNLALKKLEYISAAKRGRGAAESLEELSECVSGSISAESEFENKRIELAINDFLEGLSPDKRKIFLWRYWYFDSIEVISRRTGYSKSKIKSMLMRLRKELMNYSVNMWEGISSGSRILPQAHICMRTGRLNSMVSLRQ